LLFLLSVFVVSTVVQKLPTTLEHFIRTSLLFLATVVVNTIITPYFIIAAFIVLLAFAYFQRIIRSSYRWELPLYIYTVVHVMPGFC